MLQTDGICVALALLMPASPLLAPLLSLPSLLSELELQLVFSLSLLSSLLSRAVPRLRL